MLIDISKQLPKSNFIHVVLFGSANTHWVTKFHWSGTNKCERTNFLFDGLKSIFAMLSNIEELPSYNETVNKKPNFRYILRRAKMLYKCNLMTIRTDKGQ